eukprot:TRINITY_DN14613_c0_g1_i1.p1 TRINITY_DN14613_c0_g1~~TRINITY_DN14613_c0_g1_i1.p1  ORF type:complete len:266 (+),score=67.74 TRINITY_DN14613_c0_g1_i1:57-854(+)
MASRLLVLLLAIALFCGVFVAPAYADGSVEVETEDDTVAGSTATELEAIPEEEDTGLPDAHNEVSTVVVVPDYPDYKIPLGAVVELVVGFRNGAKTPLNVTSLIGSLNFVQDYRYYVQNFSRIDFGNTLVPPGAEVSLLYPVRPDPSLEPRDFILSATVLYEDADGRLEYATNFFNQTIELVEATGTFDANVVFVALLIAALGGLGYFVIKQQTSKSSRKKKPVVAAVETGTKTASVAPEDNEWIADIVASPKRRSRTPKSTSSK